MGQEEFGTYNLNPSAGRAGVAHLRRPTRPRVGHAVWRHAAGPMMTGLAGSERVRRHLRHRPRSVPHDGVSDGPGAYRVPVPITSQAHVIPDG